LPGVRLNVIGQRVDCTGECPQGQQRGVRSASVVPRIDPGLGASVKVLL